MFDRWGRLLSGLCVIAMLSSAVGCSSRPRAYSRLPLPPEPLFIRLLQDEPWVADQCPYGWTALHLCAYEDYVTAAERVLEEGWVEIDATTYKELWSPLAMAKSAAMVDVFMRHGADLRKGDALWRLTLQDETYFAMAKFPAFDEALREVDFDRLVSPGLYKGPSKAVLRDLYRRVGRTYPW